MAYLLAKVSEKGHLGVYHQTLSAGILADKAEQSVHLAHDVWQFSLEHTYRQSYGFHVRRPKHQNGTDMGHIGASPDEG